EGSGDPGASSRAPGAWAARIRARRSSQRMRAIRRSSSSVALVGAVTSEGSLTPDRFGSGFEGGFSTAIHAPTITATATRTRTRAVFRENAMRVRCTLRNVARACLKSDHHDAVPPAVAADELLSHVPQLNAG